MCSWAITCPNIEDVVTLVFNVFETEAGHDLVTVYDGASKDGATMTALSGSLYELESRQYTSSGKSMTLTFTSDESIGSDGFQASYLCSFAPPPPPPPPPCDSQPCYRGTCANLGGTYACHCDDGWEGRNCDATVDPCDDAPCENGSCFSQGDQFTCTCLLGWEGERCENEVPPPDPVSIQPDGVAAAGSIQNEYQESWFMLAAVAGHSYVLDCHGSTLEDTMMELYDIDRSTLLAENDDNPNNEALDSYIEWTCPADGAYYIMVRGFDTGTGTFTLTVSEAGGTGADGAPADPCDGGVLMNEPAAVIAFEPDGGATDNTHCVWAISCADSGQDEVVTLVFRTFSTELTYDTVTLNNGADKDSLGSEISVLSGSISQLQSRRWSSEEPGLTISFDSDDSVASDGFEVSYLCGPAPPPPPPPPPRRHRRHLVTRSHASTARAPTWATHSTAFATPTGLAPTVTSAQTRASRPRAARPRARTAAVASRRASCSRAPAFLGLRATIVKMWLTTSLRRFRSRWGRWSPVRSRRQASKCGSAFPPLLARRTRLIPQSLGRLALWTTP